MAGSIEDQAGVLADLKSDDREKNRRAMEGLYDELRDYARACLGQRQQQVNCQEESVVQSVIARELGGGVDAFNNDGHLHGRLRLAVKHKIFDRHPASPRGRTAQISQLPDGAQVDGEGTGPGVATRIAEIDRQHEVESRLLRELSADDKKLVRLCVLGDLNGREAASQLPITHDMVRQRLRRLRPTLRARLLEPLKTKVSAEDWATISACLIERMPPDRASELLGCTPEALAATHERLFQDVLGPTLGNAGMLALTRLLGRSKA